MFKHLIWALSKTEKLKKTAYFGVGGSNFFNNLFQHPMWISRWFAQHAWSMPSFMKIYQQEIHRSILKNCLVEIQVMHMICQDSYSDDHRLQNPWFIHRKVQAMKILDVRYCYSQDSCYSTGIFYGVTIIKYWFYKYILVVHRWICITFKEAIWSVNFSNLLFFIDVDAVDNFSG